MATSSEPALVTLYWRPGCPYCATLRRGLRGAGLATNEVNIWTDPEVAATLRSLAGGNETVPTVVIARTGLLNPSAREVLDAVCAADPGAMVDRRVTPQLRRVSVLAVVQWLVVIALISVSFAVEAAGHSGLSWGVDAVNLVVSTGFRFVRRRLSPTESRDLPASGRS